ncbi:precorrin-2 dehydrogenase/sirohydrochlorin ferrochelatase [Alkalihalobacillus xiaoxiensis]|uniref:precorrin-2 dehydrogenase n=1 Tax=Shouchella xiaoxiensis TaxID=766895 RepID=A0ABS2ST90_9BACI|nr:precorrin-2 dehydrogenase/sirohydrochlorin ferrochelatase [Shouchella xiaoxiensis]
MVIGGGSVALRRTRTVIEAGGSVYLITGCLTSEWTALIPHPKITHEKRMVSKRECFLSDALLLCTNDKNLHDALMKNRAPRQLVYRADNASRSDIHFPAIIRKGLLTIALSTSGASPVYTKRLRKKIVNQLSDTTEEDLLFLKHARERILNSRIHSSEKRFLVDALASTEVLTRVDRESWLSKQLDEMGKI